MWFDPYLPYLSQALTFLLVFVGALVTVKTDWVEDHKRLVVAMFVLPGLLMLSIDWRQLIVADRLADEARKLEEQKDESDGELRRVLAASSVASIRSGEASDRASEAYQAQSKQLRAAQAQNSEFSRLNIELTRKNVSLTEEVIQRTIGDPEKPPYLKFFDFDIKGDTVQARGYLINSSRMYSARNVSLTIKLEDQTFTSESQDIPPSGDRFVSRVPVTFPGSMADNKRVGFPQLKNVGDVFVTEVAVTAEAGAYIQRIALIRISENMAVQGASVCAASDCSSSLVTTNDPLFPKMFDPMKMPLTNSVGTDEGKAAQD